VVHVDHVYDSSHSSPPLYLNQTVKKKKKNLKNCRLKMKAQKNSTQKIYQLKLPSKKRKRIDYSQQFIVAKI